MRDGQRYAVIGGVAVAVAAIVGFGAYSVLEEGGGEDTGSVAATFDEEPGEPTVETGPPSREEVTATAAEFLRAWEAGEFGAAATLTDDEPAARDALSGLTEDASLTELAIAPGAPANRAVPFSVDATIGYDEQGVQGEADWSYESELTVVRDEASGDPVVRWEPDVLYPGLTDGQSLATGPLVDQAPVEVLDATGNELTAEDHPTLAGVLADVAERYADQAGASAGAALDIVDAEGGTVERLMELAQPVSGQVPTTIDPVIQQAAEEAVAAEDEASVVAVQPSTGEIRAIANSPAEGFNTALEGSYAPGSTFKVVTASLLISEGLASATEPHPCPRRYEYGGWRFHNVDNFSIEGGTFAESFAASCNTAFISQAPELEDDSLGNYARDVFGLGLPWEVGTRTMDGSVPTESDAQMAAALIGQGSVRMNPLTMASVSATVRNGGFLQPHLVPPSFDGRTLAQAPGAMSADVAAEMRGLMNTTALSGTAAGAMAGLDGEIGAKTGSAEVDGQRNTNAWFTAYRNDLAAAAVVPDSGQGGEFAGPIVADILRTAP